MQEAAVEDGARQVYPEYSFNFYVDDGEKEEFKKRFHFETAADDAEFWVNGQADLVVKTKDGKLKVYDYKSDSRNGKPIPDFEEACAKKYAGQLDLYKYTMAKTFAMAEENITTKLIHLYM